MWTFRKISLGRKITPKKYSDSEDVYQRQVIPGVKEIIPIKVMVRIIYQRQEAKELRIKTICVSENYFQRHDEYLIQSATHNRHDPMKWHIKQALLMPVNRCLRVSLLFAIHKPFELKFSCF